MIYFIRDGLHLSFGFFETKSEFSHIEIERGYNIFGQMLLIERRKYSTYRVLRSGDGITTFKTETELLSYLNNFPKYTVFCSDLIHSKFYADRDTCLELSRQDLL